MVKLKTNRGTISIELAIILVGILIPLIVGSIDFMFAMLGRGDVLASLMSIEQFSTSYPTNATNQAEINKFLNQQKSGIYQYNPATISFACLQKDGSEQQATIAYTNGQSISSLSTAAASSNVTAVAPPVQQAQIGTNNIGTVSCASGYLQTFATYYIAENISLPIYMPVFGSHFTYKASGTVWIQ